MADEIRSHVANENFRKGWDETFGKKRLAPGMAAALRAGGNERTWNGGDWVEVSNDEAHVCDSGCGDG